MSRKLFDVLFWIGVSLYFGGIVTLGAVVAPALFNTARDATLSMPGIAVPPLDMPRQVGGELFGTVLARFAALEIVALAFMLAGLAGWLFAHATVSRTTWALLIFWSGLAVFTAYDSGRLRPEVWRLRADVRAQALAHVNDSDEADWPARQRFDVLHKRTENLNQLKAYLLLGSILVAAWRGAQRRALWRRTLLGPFVRPRPWA